MHFSINFQARKFVKSKNNLYIEKILFLDFHIDPLYRSDLPPAVSADAPAADTVANDWA